MFSKPIILIIILILLLVFYLVIRLGAGKKKDIEDSKKSNQISFWRKNINNYIGDCWFNFVVFYLSFLE